MKDQLRTLSRENRCTFAKLWNNLILERFLARLSQSQHKKNFIFKGGALLARYIDLGRETRDLDFLVKNLSNAIVSLHDTLDEICHIDLKDGFFFELLDISPLDHPHMHYTGAKVTLLARLGHTKTHLHIDLGFGDIVEAINHPIQLISTKKKSLFESQIDLSCYPKEFIFAEKLETVIFQGSSNSHMKDFYDLYSLVSLPNCLDNTYVEKVIRSVFSHRNTPINKLPLHFENEGLIKLEERWKHYSSTMPTDLRSSLSFQDLVVTINEWLDAHTKLFTP